jgi:hypothetical protein
VQNPGKKALFRARFSASKREAAGWRLAHARRRPRSDHGRLGRGGGAEAMRRWGRRHGSFFRLGALGSGGGIDLAASRLGTLGSGGGDKGGLAAWCPRVRAHLQLQSSAAALPDHNRRLASPLLRRSYISCSAWPPSLAALSPPLLLVRPPLL